MIGKHKKAPHYRNVAFVVSFRKPKNLSVRDCRQYVQDAVSEHLDEMAKLRVIQYVRRKAPPSASDD